MPKRSYIRLSPPSTNITWSETSVTVAVGSSVTVTHDASGTTLGTTELDGFLNGIATSSVAAGSATFTGVSAGTATIPAGSQVGSTAYSTNALTITVTAAADDNEFLNKRGLTHFWSNIDTLKQDTLGAGDVISSMIAAAAVTDAKMDWSSMLKTITVSDYINFNVGTGSASGYKIGPIVVINFDRQGVNVSSGEKQIGTCTSKLLLAAYGAGRASSSGDAVPATFIAVPSGAFRCHTTASRINCAGTIWLLDNS